MSVLTPTLDAPVLRPRPARRPVVATKPFPLPAKAPSKAPVTVERRTAHRVLSPTVSERSWVMLAHLSGVVSSAAGPLAIARVVGPRSAYVRQQALAAANFQLAFLAALAPMLLLGVLTFGLAALFVVPLVLAWGVTTLLATFAAAGGERYRYPVAVPVLR
ncbi:DUF4870 domain-containing protein [Cryptosporangium phraense]|uniref:DUF4870 domain-containing protein n=1 Tax=Cryptosporangium phraense TaxID=2593070 RepID=A0A545APJ3_9ACTN|nr:DUF4870 domain-containing protein [Cryptosporangium phraense]TQS43247.1 DUF4870 domain-containing protein [Cryptosporangium phraense]